MPPRSPSRSRNAPARNTSTAIVNPEQVQRSIANVDAREQHPTIAAIQARMPAVLSMLPPGMNEERFANVVIQAIVKNPDILQCTPESIIAAVVEAAQDGLEPTGARGGAHLVRYGNVAQLIRDYRGIIRIIIESGAAKDVESHAVRRGDHFELQYGAQPPVVHRPQIPPDPTAEELGYYALFTRPDGTQQVEFMSMDELAAVQAKAAANSPAWKDFAGQMRRKAVIKRGANYLNLRPDVRERLWREDQFEYGDETTVARVPAADLAERRQAIADRRARLTGGTQPPTSAEARVPEAVATPPPASADPAPNMCVHPPDKYVTTDAGVECGVCHATIAQRDPDAKPLATDTDTEQLRKRAFATATSRGLDGDAVKRIAAAMFAKPEARATFSRTAMTADQWDVLAKAIDSAIDLSKHDAGDRVDAASSWAGTCAVRALPIDAKDHPDPWPIIDPMVTAMMDEEPTSMTAAQWIEFGLRIAAGERPA